MCPREQRRGKERLGLLTASNGKQALPGLRGAAPWLAGGSVPTPPAFSFPLPALRLVTACDPTPKRAFQRQKCPLVRYSTYSWPPHPISPVSPGPVLIVKKETMIRVTLIPGRGIVISKAASLTCFVRGLLKQCFPDSERPCWGAAGRSGGCSAVGVT